MTNKHRSHARRTILSPDCCACVLICAAHIIQTNESHPQNHVKHLESRYPRNRIVSPRKYLAKSNRALEFLCVCAWVSIMQRCHEPISRNFAGQKNRTRVARDTSAFLLHHFSWSSSSSWPFTSVYTLNNIPKASASTRLLPINRIASSPLWIEEREKTWHERIYLFLQNACASCIRHSA